MTVLVDTSVWIDYFRGGKQSNDIDHLIGENLAATNELILCELIPALNIQGQNKLVGLLNLLPKHSINIDWEEIRSIQVKCLKKGFNGIGIPDLILTQNALQHRVPLYTLDKHFHWISQITALKLL